jgi:multidrug efflux pump subunit AcrA (membrane-fusion protein)
MTLATPETDGEDISKVCEPGIAMPSDFLSPTVSVVTKSVSSHVGTTRRRRPGRWLLPVLGLAALFAIAAAFLGSNKEDAPAAGTPHESQSANVLRVSIVQPKSSAISRTIKQPGSVHVFDYQTVFAKVSGYLQVQNVDIGSHVKEGDVLAVLEAPEVVEARRQAEAEVQQANAQVQLMEAAVETARADVKAAEAIVRQSRADLKRAKAYLDYRKIDFRRLSELYAQKAIEEVLVDESQKNLDASEADKDLKEAAIETATAQVAAKTARVDQASADLENAKAKVLVSKAALAKARAFEEYLTLRSKYNGVVTLRNFHVGDFIRAAEQGGQIPMLSVARTDLMRVVVQVDDKSAPYVFPRSSAVVTLDSLPGEVFKAAVSRTADIIGGGVEEGSLTQIQNRTMRIEIDLKNPDGRIKGGMYGWVTLQLKVPPAAVESVSVLSTCLMGTYEDGTDRVFVVQDGRAHGKRVKVLHENGVDIVVTGIGREDRVISQSSGSLFEGAPVEVVE